MVNSSTPQQILLLSNCHKNTLLNEVYYRIAKLISRHVICKGESKQEIWRETESYLQDVEHHFKYSQQCIG